MTKYLFLAWMLMIALVSCNDDTLEANDYRQEYIGTYSATKSTESFDSVFRTDIDDIIVSSKGDSIIIIDEIELTLDADGTTGQQLVDGVFYNLSFEDNELNMLTYPDILGDAVGCYISGVKQ